MTNQTKPDSAAPGGDGETIIQRVIDELREEEHERRQEDRDAGISPDAETADQLATWANQLVLAKWRLSEDAALSAPKQVGLVADGWVMVPLEPTKKMLEAGVDAAVNKAKGNPWCPYAWEAMLAAAPNHSTVDIGDLMFSQGAAMAVFTDDEPCSPQAAPVPVEGEGRFFVAPPGLHPNTVNLIGAFAGALAEKLAQAEKKYGYSDGWASRDWMDECRSKLVEHIAKGDPRDVAAYCAFLWHHGESTTPPPEQPAVELEQFRPAVEALERAGRTSEVIDGVLHLKLNEKHWRAQKLFALIDGAKTGKGRGHE